MKKTLLLIIFTCTLFLLRAQVTPSKVVRIQNASTAFNEDLPIGTIINDASSGKTYVTFLGLYSWRSIDSCTPYVDIFELTNASNIAVQTLNGVYLTWDASYGINAKLTISGTTTITLTNLIPGTSGNLTIINTITAWPITFAGYGNKINPAIYSSANNVLTSGFGKIDVYSWYYDGTYLIWNGSLNYQ